MLFVNFVKNSMSKQGKGIENEEKEREKGLINPLPTQRHLSSSDLRVVPPWSHTAFKVPSTKYT